MQTALVINAGLGGLTLGIKQAGSKVIAVYEKDTNAIKVHKQNFDIPIYTHISQDNTVDCNNLDLLAAHIHIKTSSRIDTWENQSDYDIIQPLKLLKSYRPHKFLFFVNFSGFRKTIDFFLNEIIYIGYHYAYHIIDIGEALGLPLKEKTICIIGTRDNDNDQLFFPDFIHKNSQ